MTQARRRRPEVFCRNCVLRNFAKLTGKHLCQSVHLCTCAPLAQVFSCEFCKISKNTFLQWPLFTVAASGKYNATQRSAVYDPYIMNCLNLLK